MNSPVARRLRAARERLEQDLDPSIPPRPPGSRPVSHEQERVWLVDRILGGSTEYNVPDCVTVRGDLDVAALEEALTALVARHEVLRTVFIERDGTPGPVVLAADRVPVALSTAQDAAAARRSAQAEAVRPFDLGRDLPVRCAVIRYGARDWLVLLTVHHIATDGPSLELMWREIWAHRAGCELPAPPLQYADFAHWQRTAAPTRAQDLDHWAEVLAGSSGLSLRPRTSETTGQGAELQFTVSAELAGRLRELGARHEVTLFMTLLAAFEVVLSTLSGLTDVVVGTPVSGRGRSELQDVLGPFVNTLVLRTRLGGAVDFADVLARVRATTLDALTHQDVPFARLVQHLRPERELGRNPLFDILFAFEDERPATSTPSGAVVRPISLESGRSKFDLSLTLTDGGREAGLQGTICWSTDLFDHDYVRRLADRYARLLSAVVAEPTAPLSGLVTDPTELRMLVEDWGRGPARVVDPRPLHDLILDQAVRTPGAVAVGDGATELRYAELAELSERLATELTDLGVVRDEVVGVRVRRSAGLVVAMLAVWRAGGAYLPLDPDQPVRRTDDLLADSGARVLIDDEGLHALRVRPGTGSSRRAVADPEQAAYLIYTSGSTGRPKGVLVPHRALSNFAADMIDRIGFGPHDVVGAVTPPSFDIAVLELLIPLATGSRVELVSRADAVDGKLLGEALTRSAATVVQATPASWAILVAADWPGGPVRALCGGEALSAGLARQISARVDELWNVYGPTETTVWSTAQRIEPDRPVGLGSPLLNTSVYVLDAQLRQVVVGAVGELHIGGAGVARGYSRQPALTARQFLPDPFAAVHGARMYGTGDLVRYAADGRLEFLGRRDSQVKIRGHRIELGEVEARLGEHPAIAQVVVLAPGTGLDRVLVAYVVWRTRPGQGWPEVQEALRANLPEHMVPALAVELERLPTTPHGKVDRQALPPPAPSGGCEPPRTERERRVMAVWETTLGRSDFGVEDDFFTVGGHSLKATRMVAALRERLGVDVPVRLLFERRTVRALAEALDTVSAALPMRVEPRTGPIPLSHAQSRMWFLEQLRPGRTDYLVPSVVRLTGRVDLAALHERLVAVVERHEVLRTRFALVGDRPVQVVGGVTPLWTSVVDVASEDAALEQVREVCTRPFDLERGPLLRARMIRISESVHLLAVVFHHAVVDGWSLPVFWEEVGRGHGRADRRQYRDYTRWEEAAGAGYEADLAQWRRVLEGSTPSEVSTDHLRPAQFDESAGLIDFDLPAELASVLPAAAGGHTTTPFVLLLAGFMATVGVLSGRADVVVGTPVAGRGRRLPEFAEVIGPLINTVAVRADVDADFATVVHRVQEAVLDADAHQDLPFEQLVDQLAPGRDLGRHPIFQITFALDEDETAGLTLPGVRVCPVRPGVGGAKFDLSLTMRRDGDRWGGTLLFARALYEAGTAQDLVDTYLRLLTAVAASPHTHVAELDLAGPAGWAALRPGEPLPSAAACLHELVALVAAARPDTVAVQMGDASLTYRDLMTRSRRLAVHLRSRGAGPGGVVAVLMPRSIDLVIALLAVLRSGASCLPLPAGQPADRIELLLSDAGTSMVVTDADDHGAVAAELPAVDPASTAYLTYTSGSTGRPKAVPTSHRAAAGHLTHVIGAYGLGPDDTVLQLAEISFDAAIRDIVGPLAAGARLVLLPDDSARDPHAIRQEMSRRHVTALLSVVPSLLGALTAVDAEPACLRLVLTSGETLPAALARRARALGPDPLVVNQYGPTECTMTTTHHRVGAHEDPVPIGIPVPGSTVLVLGPRGRLLPTGAVGELYIGGAGLSTGYRGAARLTAQRFGPNPYGPPGSRLYRTGDLGRRRHDGTIIFHGRTDDQLKVRGVRVEPVEVEAVLAQLPEVHGCAVVGHLIGGRLELVAFLVGDADLVAVRAHVAARLPEQMRPSRYVRLHQLPVTAHGKLDRAGLRASVLPAQPPASTVGPTPRDRTELRLLTLWEQLFGHSPIGVDENFFELGGHSLRAVELVESVWHALDVRLPLNTVFLHPTVRGMAGALRSVREGGPQHLVVPLTGSDNVETPLFLVHPQSGDICCYLPLARALAGWRPIHGIEAAGYSTDETPCIDLAGMACRYIDELRTVQPTGPYLLAGWSFGGNVVVEMAARLEAVGEQVAFVGILDAREFGADAPEEWYGRTDELSRFALIQGVGQGRLADVDPDVDPDVVLTLLTAHLTEQDRLPGSADGRTVRRMIEVFTANGRAADSYRPGASTTAADLWVFRTSERHPTLTNPVVDPESWRRRTRGALHVVEIPGNHHDLASPPHVDVLAERLRQAVERQLGNGSAP